MVAVAEKTKPSEIGKDSTDAANKQLSEREKGLIRRLLGWKWVTALGIGSLATAGALLLAGVSVPWLIPALAGATWGAGVIGQSINSFKRRKVKNK